MTTRKLASAAAAASLAGAAVLGMAAAATPALAQTTSPRYPPVTGNQPSITDATPTSGQTITAGSGDNACPAGTVVTVTVPGTTISGTEIADANGNVDFTFPAPSKPGRYEVVFACAIDGETVSVSFTVVAAAAGGPGRGQGEGGNSALPRTGADSIVPLTITGLAMVGIGGGVVVAARRRREDMPGGIA